MNLSGLPSGLGYAGGSVSGTVASDAGVGDYAVTITASAGSKGAVSEAFSVAVESVGGGVSGEDDEGGGGIMAAALSPNSWLALLTLLILIAYVILKRKAAGSA